MRYVLSPLVLLDDAIFSPPLLPSKLTNRLYRARGARKDFPTEAHTDHEPAQPGTRHPGADSVSDLARGRAVPDLRTLHPAVEFAIALEGAAGTVGGLYSREASLKFTKDRTFQPFLLPR